MQYVKVIFPVTGGAESEMLMAMLADAGYDGFEETEKELFAYIEQSKFREEELKHIAGQTIAYRTEVIPTQNWNALWESNFEPVTVAGFCTVRAHFHEVNEATPFNIVITPKMSFGTGHHATTQQMMLQMKDMQFAGCTVLDFGTGTGVLAILAEMLGAAEVLAIDNDEWSVENAKENIERNGCKNIAVEKGSIEDLPFRQTEVILANINRNILLQYMQALYERLTDGGVILMSGLLAEDKDTIMQSAAMEGFYFKKATEQMNWISLLFEKKKATV